MAREAMNAAVATLSLKDAQRCFDKERQLFLRDLETLRQQLVKKDQGAARAAAAASAHTIQLKREIASLQNAMTAIEAERTNFQGQFAHTSSLLETALDQRQEDQTKFSRLNEKLRRCEKKHEETVDLVKKEAAANVRATQEERQALRARVEQLRGKLESEQKEWQNVHRPVADELQKSKTRLQLVDKELQDARYRERSSFQLKEKMGAEVTAYKRKVADLSTALQEALHAKNEMKSEHSLMIKHMKEKWREVLRNHQHAKEQLWMLQEDYDGLFRSRTCIEQQNEQIYQSMKQLKVRHEQIMKAKEEECWEIEKKHKKTSATCPHCLKTLEQRKQEEVAKMDAVREQTRLEVTTNMELERWDRFQEVNTKYLDTCRQLQTAVEESEVLRSKHKTVTKQHDELKETEQRLSSMLKESQAKLREVSSKREEEAQQVEGTKKTMQDLVENLTSLTSVTADQSKKLQELEAARLEEHDILTEQIRNLEADKKSIAQDHEQLTHRYEEFVAQYELLKQEKSKHWNEIVAAQLSANLLIEEQAHTIDDLLQAKADGTYVSPSKSKLAPNCAAFPASPESSMGPIGHIPTPTEHANLVAALRQECAVLQEEVARFKSRAREERVSWHGDIEKREGELLHEIKTLQLGRQKLKKRLGEQALTIHELTLQEEEEEEEEEDENDGNEDQSCTYSNGQVAADFNPGVSCADSCASLPVPSENDRWGSTQPNYYSSRHPSDEFWLPPPKSSDRDRISQNRPRNGSPFRMSDYGLLDAITPN